ncbi:MAG TPA: SDR family oxidoreductase [Euzebyales bacterium]|nr:SDR family oxidoreductase [Euzebyales bacterium]
MILVTGATGTVGSGVCRQLHAAGVRPRALVRDGAAARTLLGDRIDPVEGDLDRPETLDPALAGIDRLFLLTRQSRRQPEQERAIIDAAARAGTMRIVKLSVFRADKASQLRIARQHADAEQAVRRSGLAHVFVRPVFFMQNLIRMARAGALYTAAGDGRVAMVDARDVAAVSADLLRGPLRDRRAHTLTGPQAMTFDEAAEILSDQTGRRFRHVRVSPADVRTALERSGVEPWFAADMARLHSMLADGYEDRTTDDVRAVTGTSPRTLAEFGRDLAHHLR